MENEKRKAAVQVTEGSAPASAEKTAFSKERLKKPIIFGIMGLACAICLYFIFGQDMGSSATEEIKVGINDAVPQASGAGLPTDKGKAYEQEMLREREQQKKDAMMSLSDYWQSDSIEGENNAGTVTEENRNLPKPQSKGNPAVHSYRSMQHSLHTFYQPQAGQDALRKENEALKEKLEAKEPSRGRTTDDRLALMEQSYKMAAKYFPGSAAPADIPKATSVVNRQEDDDFLTVQQGNKSVVSRLQRQVQDSVTLARVADIGSNTFTTATHTGETAAVPNSITACIHQGVKVTADSNVQLRLTQEARIGDVYLPSGFILSAVAKFQQNRLQLQVVSVEIEGSIIPVNLTVYDLDGQKGLNVPFSPEVTAVNGTLANMGNTAGSSFTINRSAGQQLTADATRSLVQGVSGYFSKKVRTQKVTLKAGHQIFLVSKKK